MAQCDAIGNGHGQAHGPRSVRAITGTVETAVRGVVPVSVVAAGRRLGIASLEQSASALADIREHVDDDPIETRFGKLNSTNPPWAG
jgi:hypothetical protein